MPEVAIDKNNESLFGENEVWISVEKKISFPADYSVESHQSDESKLGRLVSLTPYKRHDL